MFFIYYAGHNILAIDFYLTLFLSETLSKDWKTS